MISVLAKHADFRESFYPKVSFEKVFSAEQNPICINKFAEKLIQKLMAFLPSKKFFR